MATLSQITTDPALETHLFWDQYKTTIIAVVLVLVLGGLGYGGYQLYTAQQASTAMALLTAARSPEQYQQVITRYPGSGPAASACLLLAAEQRAKKNYTEANATLHKFIDQFPKHDLITTAWMGVAANLESLGKSDEALSTYQRLASEYPQSFNAPLALLAQVPLMKAKNRNDEARRVCETIISQYRDSILANEAMRELISLPKPATPPVAMPAPTMAPIPMARPPETAVPSPAASPKS
jgi:predicted negative regulator of RcsB-dependent stress response